MNPDRYGASPSFRSSPPSYNTQNTRPPPFRSFFSPSPSSPSPSPSRSPPFPSPPRSFHFPHAFHSKTQSPSPSPSSFPSQSHSPTPSPHPPSPFPFPLPLSSSSSSSSPFPAQIPHHRIRTPFYPPFSSLLSHLFHFLSPHSFSHFCHRLLSLLSTHHVISLNVFTKGFMNIHIISELKGNYMQKKRRKLEHCYENNNNDINDLADNDNDDEINFDDDIEDSYLHSLNDLSQGWYPCHSFPLSTPPPLPLDIIQIILSDMEYHVEENQKYQIFKIKAKCKSSNVISHYDVEIEVKKNIFVSFSPSLPLSESPRKDQRGKGKFSSSSSSSSFSSTDDHLSFGFYCSCESFRKQNPNNHNICKHIGTFMVAICRGGYLEIIQRAKKERERVGIINRKMTGRRTVMQEEEEEEEEAEMENENGHENNDGNQNVNNDTMKMQVDQGEGNGAEENEKEKDQNGENSEENPFNVINLVDSLVDKEREKKRKGREKEKENRRKDRDKEKDNLSVNSLLSLSNITPNTNGNENGNENHHGDMHMNIIHFDDPKESQIKNLSVFPASSPSHRPSPSLSPPGSSFVSTSIPSILSLFTSITNVPITHAHHCVPLSISDSPILRFTQWLSELVSPIVFIVQFNTQRQVKSDGIIDIEMITDDLITQQKQIERENENLKISRENPLPQLMSLSVSTLHSLVSQRFDLLHSHLQTIEKQHERSKYFNFPSAKTSTSTSTSSSSSFPSPSLSLSPHLHLHEINHFIQSDKKWFTTWWNDVGHLLFLLFIRQLCSLTLYGCVQSAIKFIHISIHSDPLIEKWINMKPSCEDKAINKNTHHHHHHDKNNNNNNNRNQSPFTLLDHIGPIQQQVEKIYLLYAEHHYRRQPHVSHNVSIDPTPHTVREICKFVNIHWCLQMKREMEGETENKKDKGKKKEREKESKMTMAEKKERKRHEEEEKEKENEREREREREREQKRDIPMEKKIEKANEKEREMESKNQNPQGEEGENQNGNDQTHNPYHDGDHYQDLANENPIGNDKEKNDENVNVTEMTEHPPEKKEGNEEVKMEIQMAMEDDDIVVSIHFPFSFPVDSPYDLSSSFSSSFTPVPISSESTSTSSSSPPFSPSIFSPSSPPRSLAPSSVSLSISPSTSHSLYQSPFPSSSPAPSPSLSPSPIVSPSPFPSSSSLLRCSSYLCILVPNVAIGLEMSLYLNSIINEEMKKRNGNDEEEQEFCVKLDSRSILKGQKKTFDSLSLPPILIISIMNNNQERDNNNNKNNHHDNKANDQYSSPLSPTINSIQEKLNLIIHRIITCEFDIFDEKIIETKEGILSMGMGNLNKDLHSDNDHGTHMHMHMDNESEERKSKQGEEERKRREKLREILFEEDIKGTMHHRHHTSSTSSVDSIVIHFGLNKSDKWRQVAVDGIVE